MTSRLLAALRRHRRAVHRCGVCEYVAESPAALMAHAGEHMRDGSLGTVPCPEDGAPFESCTAGTYVWACGHWYPWGALAEESR